MEIDFWEKQTKNKQIKKILFKIKYPRNVSRLE